MLRKIREAQKNEEGFTLIELLVVVIIIGILAAIAIPTFMNQRENAWLRAAEADVRNAALGVESVLTRTDEYPTSGADLTDSSVMGDDAVSTSDGVHLDYTLDAGTSSYVIQACHENLDSGGTDCATFEMHAEYDSAAGGLQ